MRIAWFSPLPPARSGIATYSADLVPLLAASHTIDCFSEVNARDFLWTARRHPYDLVVYQLGNAPCHDYMWGYLAAFPGLVVLHDARLHHARARALLQQERVDDYRREFWYDHPEACRDFVEYAVAGLGGPIYYCWPMRRVVMRTARLIAVHNPRVAADLRDECPEAGVEVIRLGTAQPSEGAIGAAIAARGRLRALLGVPDDGVLFAVFGKITAEKRVGAILRAFDAIASERPGVHLMLAGDASDYPALDQERAATAHAPRVHVCGYVADDEIGGYLAASDACLCLRWPTALETSASWLQCLSSARPTVISDLAHLVDIPTLDPRTGRVSSAPASRSAREAVAINIDLLDEDESLRLAMRALADEPQLRDRLGRAGHAYWAGNHTLEVMAGDYQRLLAQAAARPTPIVNDLPPHMTADYSDTARRITECFDVSLDGLLGSGSHV